MHIAEILLVEVYEELPSCTWRQHPQALRSIGAYLGDEASTDKALKSASKL